MKFKWTNLLSAAAAACLLTGCGADTGQISGGVTSYKDTKSMVMDILKSDDGRKAVQEAAFTAQQGTGTNQLQILSAGDPQQLQLAVKDVLTDTTNNRFLEQLMTDPRFAGEFAKATQKNTKQLFKDLMKDPEYQKQMMDTMKSPEFERMLLETMKTTPYRAQTRTVIQESLESPLFRLELMELMKKVLEEEARPKEETKQAAGQKQGGEDGQDSDGQGEGGSDTGK